VLLLLLLLTLLPPLLLLLLLLALMALPLAACRLAVGHADGEPRAGLVHPCHLLPAAWLPCGWPCGGRWAVRGTPWVAALCGCHVCKYGQHLQPLRRWL
jgi:hypothetical protein